MEVDSSVRVCTNWYVEPSTVSSLPPILQVTLVAGPPVEMQVKVLVVALNVSSEILGMPGEMEEKQSSHAQNKGRVEKSYASRTVKQVSVTSMSVSCSEHTSTMSTSAVVRGKPTHVAINALL